MEEVCGKKNRTNGEISNSQRQMKVQKKYKRNYQEKFRD